MRRWLACVAVAAGLMIPLAGTAFADNPGPNGHNDKGLCNAYFRGSDNGQAHKHSAPPFAALEDAAGGADNVKAYCGG